MKHGFLNPTEYKRHSQLQYDFAHSMLKSTGIKETDKILDIGCGDGKITADIARMVPSGQVIGTDISSQMIHYATREHTPATSGNLGFMIMDAETNVFRSQFNLVVSFCCLHWVKNQLSALKGIKAALVENGKAVLLVPLRHEELYTAIESVVESEEWRHYFTGFNNPHVFFTKEKYSTLLDQAGLAPSLLEENTMSYSFRTQIEMEMFLKAWLPHILRIPSSRQDDFMRDIGNKFLSIVPAASSGAITMPLRMLKVQAYRPALSLRLATTSAKSSLLFRPEPSKPMHQERTSVKLMSKL